MQKNNLKIVRKIQIKMRQEKEQERKIHKKCVVISIFATEEQENMFSKIAQESMLNNAKLKENS